MFPPGRQDAVPGRLTYFDVHVGDTSAATNSIANAVCASYTIPALSVYTLNCNPPLLGRYVVVRLMTLAEAPTASQVADRDGYLGICEFQAFGTPAATYDASSPLALLASRGRPTSQSTTSVNPASYAVDGNTLADWDHGATCSNTGTTTSGGEWWQVDLQDTWAISLITIFNRCARGAERLGVGVLLLPGGPDSIRAPSLAVMLQG